MILICNMTEWKNKTHHQHVMTTTKLGDKIRVKEHLYKNYFKNCAMKGKKSKLWKRLMY